MVDTICDYPQSKYYKTKNTRFDAEILQIYLRKFAGSAISVMVVGELITTRACFGTPVLYFDASKYRTSTQPPLCRCCNTACLYPRRGKGGRASIHRSLRSGTQPALLSSCKLNNSDRAKAAACFGDAEMYRSPGFALRQLPRTPCTVSQMLHSRFLGHGKNLFDKRTVYDVAPF